MTTEMRKQDELTDDELDRVTGGWDGATSTAILNGLAAIPVVGVFTQVARAGANAWFGKNV
jgi:NCAIR mutase (PurE)-related protein